jgi:hypothetical protein
MHDDPAINQPSQTDSTINDFAIQYKFGTIHGWTEVFQLQNFVVQLISLFVTMLVTYRDDYKRMILFVQYTALIWICCGVVLPFLAGYIRARKTGLKIVVSPLTPYTLNWRIASLVLRPVLRRFRWYVLTLPPYFSILEKYEEETICLRNIISRSFLWSRSKVARHCEN